MDITDETEAKFSIGIERFLIGESIKYHNVAFRKNGESSLQIESYSQWAPEQASEVHAKEIIARAKAVLVNLAGKSKPFQSIAERLHHEHYFCYDYGNGSFALAQELNGEFQWL